MFGVLDFAGLSSEQLDHASPLIGGSMKQVKPIELPGDHDVISEGDLIGMGAVSTVIVPWGDPKVNDILSTVQKFKDGDSFELAVVLLDWIWIFHLIARDNQEWDQETDEFVAREFNPRRYYSGHNILMAPWEPEAARATMKVFQEQTLAGIPLFVELDDYFLQWHMATHLRELTDEERHEPEPYEPWPPPIQYDTSFEQELGWPQQRFSRAPSVESAWPLAEAVRPFGVSRGRRRCDPALILKRLKLDVSYANIGAAEGPEATIAPSAHTEGKQHGEFGVWCDSRIYDRYRPFIRDLNAKDTERFRKLLVDLRLAHEIAHTFFFEWGPGRAPYQKPRRLSGGMFSGKEEELFCDEFAVALLTAGSTKQEQQWLRLMQREGPIG